MITETTAAPLAIGKAVANIGLGTSTKKTRDDASNWGDRYSQVDSGTYNNYQGLKDLWNNDNQSDYTEGDAVTGTQTFKRTKKRIGNKKTKYYNFTQYGLGNQSGNQVLDQYANYLLGGGTQGAEDWVTGQRTKYTKSMQDAANKAVSGYIDPYITGQQGYVDNALESAYQEALDKLKAQKAYGYLSQTGYDKAFEKLNAQRGIVGSNMNDAYSSLVYTGENSWRQHLEDMYNTAIKGVGGWDFVNPFNAEGSEYSKQNALAQNYAHNSMNEDIINSLLASADTFTPEQWIAYGAGTQGQYNPFSDFATTSRRKKNVTSTEGINEV